MIKGIGTSQSQWINITSPGISTPYGNVSNGVDGQLRLNMSTQQYEVFANGVWNLTGEYATVNPSQRMIEILEWAESKMHMEHEVMDLVSKNLTVADAYNNYKQAETQLKMVMTLVKKDEA